MVNVVLFEPEIPENTGNIMRTCAATGARLHLIRPLGFALSSSVIKRSGVNYIDKVDYTLYDDFDDFLDKNEGEFYFFTRYGKKPHSEFNYPKLNLLKLVIQMTVSLVIYFSSSSISLFILPCLLIECLPEISI